MQTILLVDDDEAVLHALGDFLEHVAGVKCLRLSGFKEVLENEKAVLSDDAILAILDINLGHGLPSGVEICRWLQAHHFKGRCVFLTGHAKDHPLVKEAILLGGGSVFEKPLEIKSLLSMIEGLRHAAP